MARRPIINPDFFSSSHEISNLSCDFNLWFKSFKTFNRCAPFNPPLCLPRDAGEKERGGSNDLNCLNGLNRVFNAP